MSGEEQIYRLSGVQRASGLLVALGPEISGKVLAHFQEHDIERLSWEITRLGTLSPDASDALVEEAYNAVVAMEYGPQGGIDYAVEVLEKALGADRAREIGERIRASIQDVPFAFAHALDPGQLATFLGAEHPQTIALVLSYPGPDRGASIVAQLPPEMQAEVAICMAHMEQTAPEVIREVEAQMMRKLSPALALRRNADQAGGLAALVDLLKVAGRTTEHAILDALGKVDAELVEAIKQQMFVFENITQLDDRSIQRVLREVDPRDLSLALKGSGEPVKRAILRNMSTRAAKILEEDLAAMGPVRLSVVEAAQGNIVNIIRRLDEAEEIVIGRGDVLG